MATDHIRYDVLAQNALRGVVRTVLADVAKKGLPGEHHFKITFNTAVPGVRLSDRMRAQYPEAMTIVLQHQFWDLRVDDEIFEVGLSFGGIPERLAVPFNAVTAFYDPAVQFGFQFETLDAATAGGQPAPVIEKPAVVTPVEAGKSGALAPPAEAAKHRTRLEANTETNGETEGETKGETKPEAPPPRPDGSSGGEVVRLDRFRKK